MEEGQELCFRLRFASVGYCEENPTREVKGWDFYGHQQVSTKSCLKSGISFQTMRSRDQKFLSRVPLRMTLSEMLKIRRAQSSSRTYTQYAYPYNLPSVSA